MNIIRPPPKTDLTKKQRELCILSQIYNVLFVVFLSAFYFLIFKQNSIMEKIINIREGNNLHLYRSQIESKTHTNLEADLSRTNKTMFVQLKDDVEVVRFWWEEVAKEAKPQLEEEKPTQTKKRGFAKGSMRIRGGKCAYCGAPTSHKVSMCCHRAACNIKHQEKKNLDSRRYNLGLRYHKRLGEIGHTTKSLYIKAVCFGDNDGVLASSHYYIKSYLEEMLNRGITYIVVPQKTYLYYQAYFDNLQHTKVLVAAERKNGKASTAKTFLNKPQVSSFKKVLAILDEDTKQGKQTKLLIMLDKSTMFFAQYLAQEAELVEVKGVKKKHDLGDKFWSFFVEGDKGIYKKLGL